MYTLLFYFFFFSGEIALLPNDIKMTWNEILSQPEVY